MRTDTKTFADRMFRDLRKEGLTSRKARAGARLLVDRAEIFGYPEIADTARARVSMDSAEIQSLYVDDAGIARFCVCPDLDIQPLVTTVPTDEQQELSDELVAMLCDLYAAEGEEKDRLNAIYTAKRDAILAINPHIHGGLVDPDGFEFYHNIHKDTYSFRPRGFFTYAMMREQIEMICSRSGERKAA